MIYIIVVLLLLILGCLLPEEMTAFWLVIAGIVLCAMAFA